VKKLSLQRQASYTYGLSTCETDFIFPDLFFFKQSILLLVLTLLAAFEYGPKAASACVFSIMRSLRQASFLIGHLEHGMHKWSEKT